MDRSTGVEDRGMHLEFSHGTWEAHKEASKRDEVAKSIKGDEQ